jgi:hypothetical protein
MKAFLLWPVLVLLFRVAYTFYKQNHPCIAGLFISGCEFGDYIFSAMLFESVLVYVFIVGLIRILKVRRDTFWTWKEYILVGLISIVIVFGGVILAMLPWRGEFSSLSFIFLIPSYPFFDIAFANMERVWWLQKVISSIHF